MEKGRYYSEERPTRRGRQTGAGQAQRRQRIIDYIKANGPVKGTEICRDLTMSRSSLSDDIRGINTGGEIISSPKRGIYVISEKARDMKNPYSRIDRQSVRKWMILLSLLGEDRTFEGIADFLEKKGLSCAQSVLYEDIKVLLEARLIERRTDGKQRIYHSESLYETDRREVRQYGANRAQSSARVDILTYGKIDLKIRHAFPGYKRGAKRDGIRRTGKHNALTDGQVQILREFEKHPYKEKELLVTFRTNAGPEVLREISVGIIVYVVETARIYLIGENTWQGPENAPQNRENAPQEPENALQNRENAPQHKNRVIIPMDRIISVSEGSRANTCYNSPEYHRICREMFQISAEDPMKVRVRFENYPFIRDKIERLCSARKTARMEIAGNEIVFTDTVRGKGDFARYLRRFGRSAIVDSPEELRGEMINASRKILSLYGGQDGSAKTETGQDHGAGLSFGK